MVFVQVVMREVCAVITKGTMVDADLTRLGGEGMAMLSIVEHVSETGSPLIGLCVVDSSTGCFQLGQVSALCFFLFLSFCVC